MTFPNVETLAAEMKSQFEKYESPPIGTIIGANGYPLPFVSQETDWVNVIATVLSGQKVSLYNYIKEASGDVLTWSQLIKVLYEGFGAHWSSSLNLEFRNRSCPCDTIDESDDNENEIAIWDLNSWSEMYLVLNSTKTQLTAVAFFDYLMLPEPVSFVGASRLASSYGRDNEVMRVLNTTSGEHPIAQLIQYAVEKYADDYTNLWLVGDMVGNAGYGICFGKLNQYNIRFEQLNIDASDFLEVASIHNFTLKVTTEPTWDTDDQKFFDIMFNDYHMDNVYDTVSDAMSNYATEFGGDIHSKNFQQYKAGLLQVMSDELDRLEANWNEKRDELISKDDEE
jgi:hypothetical protein